ncbi:MAG: response regulator transcription factor [Pleomorphochaeta sp.]
MINILYADDEGRYRKLVTVFLESAGFNVVCVENGEMVIEYIADNINNIDLVLLDVMMPKLNGKKVCKIIREIYDIPIILLTALCDSANEVDGLNLGADDYITKPFSRDTLVARIKSVLRRVNKQKEKIYKSQGFEFFFDKGVLLIDNNKISLTPKELLLLQYLLNNMDCVLSREKILDNVWGYNYFGDPRTVDTHIKSLRSSLGKYGKNIVTARGRGYYYQSV